MTKRSKKLYTVGQMAKLCNISPEQLRHLDKQGIFHPMSRDKGNNYRYYAEDQLEDLLLIMELRRIGMPYQTITQLIGNRDLYVVKNVLDENMHSMRKELEISQRKLNQLVDLLVRVSSSLNLVDQAKALSATGSDYDFKIVDVPEHLVLYTRYIRDLNVESNYAHHYVELLKLVDQYELDCCGPITLVYHETFDRAYVAGRADDEVMGDLEINIPVTSIRPDCHQHRMFGGFRAATSMYVGHYRGIREGYLRMKEWAENMGHHVSGVSFQELLVGRTITNRAENFVTNVYLPLDVDAI